MNGFDFFKMKFLLGNFGMLQCVWQKLSQKSTKEHFIKSGGIRLREVVNELLKAWVTLIEIVSGCVGQGRYVKKMFPKSRQQ